MLAAADALRREVNGDEVSYVVTRNVNYTNVCYFRCGFCAFSKGKLAENLRGPAYVVPTEEVVRRAREAWERGAVEICLQGGIHPGFDGDYYVEVCEAVKSAVPGIHVHAFSALEVWQGAATLGEPLDSYLARLRDAGLASLPGTAAEILDDEVRAVLCPDKVNTAQWLEVHATAHRPGCAPRRRSCSAMWTRRAAGRATCSRVRDLQQRTGGFTELVPLPVRAHGGADLPEGPGAPRPDLPRGAARARGRAARAASVDHERPGLLGEARAGRRAAALRAGVNDLGGTLMNESISRAAGASHGQEMPPEQMEETIRAAGPHAAAADDAVRDAARRARRGLVRRAAARRAAQPAGRHRAPAPAGEADPARPCPRLRTSDVARLATVDPQGRPHVVPICFAIDGDTLYTAVDEKPKRTRHLQRLANIEANPRVEVLIDHYEDDWSRLWWVRLARDRRGSWTIARAVELLAAKYPQYARAAAGRPCDRGRRSRSGPSGRARLPDGDRAGRPRPRAARSPPRSWSSCTSAGSSGSTRS